MQVRVGSLERGGEGVVPSCTAECIFRALVCRMHRVAIAHLSSQQLHHFDAVLERSKPQGCAVESLGERGCEVGVGGCVRLRVRVAVWRVCVCWRVGGS